MAKSIVVTARIDEALSQQLDLLAARRDRSRAWLVGKALEHLIEAEQAFDAFIQAGEDAIDRGDFLTQEQMEAWAEARNRSADAA